MQPHIQPCLSSRHSATWTGKRSSHETNPQLERSLKRIRPHFPSSYFYLRHHIPFPPYTADAMNALQQFLIPQANARKEKLLDSYDLQRFLSDYRDLSSWIASMMGLVSSDELATDVTGAEALLERHQVRYLWHPLDASTLSCVCI